jgi:hypothetical protein
MAVAPNEGLRQGNDAIDTLLLKDGRTRQVQDNPSDTKSGTKAVTLKVSPFDTGAQPVASGLVLNVGNRKQVVTLGDTPKQVSLNSTAKSSDSTASDTITNASDTLPTAYIKPYLEMLQNHDLIKDVQQFLLDASATKDRSFQTNDVINNPSKYTPRERLITYLDLLQAKAKFDKFIDKRQEFGKDINNETEVRWAIENGLTVLGNDPEVQSLLTESMFKAYKLMLSGEILVAPPEGLSGFEQMEWQLDRNEKIQALKKDLMEGFERDIVEGGILEDGIRTGEKLETIFQQYNTTLGFYTMVLPDDVVKSKIELANKKYAEFFDKHVLPNLPDTKEALDAVIGMAGGGNLTDREKAGIGSLLPVVEPSLLAPGGSVFGELKIDLSGLRKAAERDFYHKDGDGLSRLFDPALEAMAKNHFGDGADKAKDRAQFKADVMEKLEQLLSKIDSGQVGLNDLAGNIERLVAGLQGPGGDANGYRHAVATALDGLVQAANFVSKMPGGTLGTSSVNDIMAMIALATGLAGQGIASRSGNERFFIGSSGEAGIASKMFGTSDKEWSQDLRALDLDYMDKDFLLDSLSKMSKSVTEQVKKDLPGADVVDPTGITREAIDKLLAPSLNALSETFYKDNAGAASQYKVNVTTIYTALWALVRPGGNLETLTAQVRELVDKNVTSAPDGVDKLKYKDSVVQGVMSILQATRAIYNDRNATNKNWDTIGITILHSMAGLSAMSKAIGSTIADSNFRFGIPAVLMGDDFAVHARKVMSSFFKNTGTIIGGIAGVGWLPIEFFQLIKAYKDGNSDAGDLAFLTIGIVADTIGAAEGIFGVAELLVNSAFIGRTGAQIAMLPLAFSTGFTVAAIVSWVAWAGLAAYQTVKQDKEVNKFIDHMNDDLQRLIGMKADFYNF